MSRSMSKMEWMKVNRSDRLAHFNEREKRRISEP